MQARWSKQSLLLTHSGLQLGGEPIKPGKQLQAGEPSTTLHSELRPHGLGWQGFLGTNNSVVSTIRSQLEAHMVRVLGSYV